MLNFLSYNGVITTARTSWLLEGLNEIFVKGYRTNSAIVPYYCPCLEGILQPESKLSVYVTLLAIFHTNPARFLNARLLYSVPALCSGVLLL